MFITLNISKMSLPKTLYGFITRFMPVIIFTSAFLGIIFKQNLARKALKTIIPRNANLGTWNIGLIALSDNLTRQIEKYKPIWKWDQWIIKVLNIFSWEGGGGGKLWGPLACVKHEVCIAYHRSTAVWLAGKLRGRERDLHEGTQGALSRQLYKVIYSANRLEHVPG